MEPQSGLGDINKQLTKRLYESLGQADIYPWFAMVPRGASRVATAFARYDPILTGFQILPNSPRFFEASLRSGLLSNAAATLLSNRLVEVAAALLEKYDGYFAAELKNGRVGEIIARAQRPHNSILAEAYDDFLPDELYAALLWPCFLTIHLTKPLFAVFEIDAEAFQRASQSPLEALSVAVDIVNMGPSFGLRIEEILALLDCLQGRDPATLKRRSSRRIKHIHRIFLPQFSQGLQGLTFGVFMNLTLQQQTTAMNRLLQFGSTFEELCLYDRRRRATAALASASNLREVADALLVLMPPIETLHLKSEGAAFSYRLQFEQGYCAGYMPSEHNGRDAPSAAEGVRHVMTLNAAGQRLDVSITPLNGYPQFDSDMAMLRLVSSLVFGGITAVPEVLSTNQPQENLSLRDLISVRAGLEQQPLQGRGAQWACRCLYLIETIIQNHDKGEALISNDGARKFMQSKIEGKATGYQVVSKALKRLIQEAEKLLPGMLRFTPVRSSAVKISWRPVSEQTCIDA